MVKTVDRIDKQILAILIENPTEPFLKIAKKLDISPSTVKKRYEKMKNRVFSNPFVIIDLSKLGFQGKAFLLVSNSIEGNPQLTLDKLHQMPNVFLIAETIGKFDFIVYVAFRDIKEIKKIVNEIRELPSVKKVDVTLTEQTDFPTRRQYSTSS